MYKFILAGATIALLAVSPLASTAFSETDDAAAHGDHHWTQERAALLDARLTGFRAGLKLTADQDKNWPAFENALRGVAKSRADRRREMRAHEDNDERPTLIERLHRISDRMAQRSTDVKLVADAAAPLYASLDDGQKRIFDVLFRDLAREARHGGRDRR
jgi:hypothetical protein